MGQVFFGNDPRVDHNGITFGKNVTNKRDRKSLAHRFYVDASRRITEILQESLWIAVTGRFDPRGGDE